MYTCAMCSDKYCHSGNLEKLPANCLCREAEELDNIKNMYLEKENHKIALNAALVEAEGYCRKTRLEEIIDFANKCSYKKLGIAFCVGLSEEARILCNILKNNGFDISSIACKNGSIPKEFIGITDDKKVRPGFYEPMCNPIGQAIFLNKEKTDLNILLGLCVGHDTLFIKHSEAPITIFGVKDRVLAHNPVAALYMSKGYFKGRFTK